MRQGAQEVESPTAAAVMCAIITLALSLPLIAAPRLLGPVPTPLFPILTVYFWTVQRPVLLPPPLVFLAGVGLDLLTATPFGFWALCLLAVSGFARMVRPVVVGAPFAQRMGGAAGAVGVAAVVGLVALSAADQPAGVSQTQLLQLILTIAVYPILEAAYLALAKAAGLGRGRT